MFKKIILITICIAVIILATKYWKKTQSGNPETSNKIEQILSASDPTPNPQMPFYDLTMPYLLGRSYVSSLAALDLYREYPSYTSYLTSYQSDGLKVNGLLTIPKEPKPEGGYPAIVFVHGYIAPTIYKTTKRYNDYVNYLASRGFVVFKIDLRGHDKSEGEAGGAYYSNDYVVDTLNAYAALQTADFVNPNRIGLWGHSMAGNVTFKAFVTKNIPAVAIWAGAGYTYEDLLSLRISDNSYRAPQQSSERARKRQVLRETYGEFNPNHSFWKLVPATNYLEGVTGSVSLHHAADDQVVSVDYSKNLDKILSTTDISHELHQYPSGGHNLSGSTFTRAMNDTVQFFKEKLQ